MKLISLLTVLLLALNTYSQNGILKGTISDKNTDKLPLAYASISLEGTSIGTNSDLDGNFQLSLPAGTHRIVFSYLGYETEVEIISISKGEIKNINKKLNTDSYELEGVVVQVSKNRNKESALLLDQFKSLEIQQNIGSQELSRKGVGNVAAAVIKTAGVSKQESSGSIFVRGLGDRYNSTSMNGLPIASNDPENKNIDLGLFSTDIVEYISIDKTYSSRNYGDFGGANIDIISKKQSGEGFFDFSIGSSVNSNAVSQDKFRLLSGRNYLGFSDNKLPVDGLNKYAFTNESKVQNISPYGFNFGFNTGKSFNIGAEGNLHLFATASFENDYKYKEGITRNSQAQGDFTKNLEQKTFSYNTNTTGMFNADYSINSENNIKYNLLYINGSTESNNEYTGYFRDLAETGDGGFLRRGEYKQNTLIVNQLLGKHSLSEPLDLNWGFSHNKTTGETPDRLEYMTKINANKDVVFVNNSNNYRYFDHLKETEFAFNASLDYKFSKNEENTFDGKVIVGYNGRKKDRGFRATQFNLNIRNASSHILPDINDINSFYNQENLDKGLFDIRTFRGGKTIANALDPQTYEGNLLINAGFATLEYKLSSGLFAVLSARVENISQDITWQTQLDPDEKTDKFKKLAILPSLSLKYELNNYSNLRLAASKTYTLPQFKERALFIYDNVTDTKRGNPDLYASDNYNLDVKWEYLPENDEIISATLFGKYIKNPINETLFSSSADDITYINTGDYGYVAGIEVELRKTIYSFEEDNTNKITGGLNAAYMRTHQILDDKKVETETALTSSFTNKTSKFSGASDLLLNADISYIKDWGDKNITTTVSYAHFSDKISAIGTDERGNLVDKSFGSLDFIFKTKFNKKFGLGISAKNLLDPKIERVQEKQNILVQSYKLGRNYSLSLNYSF